LSICFLKIFFIIKFNINIFQLIIGEAKTQRSCVLRSEYGKGEADYLKINGNNLIFDT